MWKGISLTFAAAALAITVASGAALADDCSGHNHAGGTVLGAIAGGLIGGAATHGNGGAIVGGAILGGVAGNAISRDMDCEDRPYAARSYDRSFHGRIGVRYHWHRGPDHGYVVSNRQYRDRDEICRNFTQVVYRHGERYVEHGTACHHRDDDWRFH